MALLYGRMGDIFFKLKKSWIVTGYYKNPVGEHKNNNALTIVLASVYTELHL
jgi:hypothetical protein